MKKWILRLLAVSVGGMTLYYLLSEEKVPNEMTLTRTVILSIIKELKRELAGPLISLANLSQTIIVELNQLRRSEIKSVIKDNCMLYLANLISQIKSIEKRIYNRYNTNKKSVRKVCEEQFSDDK
jgi:hypothetical protein